MIDRLLSILAPHICIMCGTEGALLCERCFPDAIDPIPARCYRCSATSANSAVCNSCRRNSPLRYVWVTTQYDGPPKELVYRLKFGRTKQAASVIASYLHETVPVLPPSTVVTFVPTATSRVRQRGYDQIQLIARAFARYRGLQCAPLLVRYGQSRQVGSDRKHRFDQAAKNYGTLKKVAKGTDVLLIDDILTTGATLESAAKLLKQAGAKTINAAIFAQKQ
jgi:ComF family protein